MCGRKAYVLEFDVPVLLSASLFIVPQEELSNEHKREIDYMMGEIERLGGNVHRMADGAALLLQVAPEIESSTLGVRHATLNALQHLLEG